MILLYSSLLKSRLIAEYGLDCVGVRENDRAEYILDDILSAFLSVGIRSDPDDKEEAKRQPHLLYVLLQSLGVGDTGVHGKELYTDLRGELGLQTESPAADVGCVLRHKEQSAVGTRQIVHRDAARDAAHVDQHQFAVLQHDVSGIEVAVEDGIAVLHRIDDIFEQGDLFGLEIFFYVFILEPRVQVAFQ